MMAWRFTRQMDMLQEQQSEDYVEKYYQRTAALAVVLLPGAQIDSGREAPLDRERSHRSPQISFCRVALRAWLRFVDSELERTVGDVAKLEIEINVAHWMRC